MTRKEGTMDGGGEEPGQKRGVAWFCSYKAPLAQPPTQEPGQRCQSLLWSVLLCQLCRHHPPSVCPNQKAGSHSSLHSLLISSLLIPHLYVYIFCCGCFSHHHPHWPYTRPSKPESVSEIWRASCLTQHLMYNLKSAAGSLETLSGGSIPQFGDAHS